jgi:aminomethyltransferase
LSDLQTEHIKYTTLYNQHKGLGAKLVPFAGWQMPLYYTSILQEHLQVRKKVGIFDVSHMGRIDIIGKDAEQFLEAITTNIISGKKDHQVIYTLMCNDDGGVVDDMLVYRLNQEHFFIVANAGNRIKDLTHLKDKSAQFDVKIQDYYEGYGILAVQGPKAITLIKRLYPTVEEKVMTLYLQDELLISTTGYTGSGGVEIFASNSIILKVWNTLFEEGKDLEIAPIGLGARDTLRLEKGYALYGHELSEEILPNETIASWAVKLKKEHFLGKKAIIQLKSPRKQYGVVLEKGGIPREGFEVFKEGVSIGSVTSGSHSPSLDQGIALVMVNCELQKEDVIEIKVRKKYVRGRVHPLPFV